ncbi:putative methyltransferase PMT27 [Hordeum vulgare]|nr:putative methyltransferase PMT27 [Hordeum vulgare]
MEFGMHLVETRMRKMDLTMVYTNNPVMVEESINTMEWFLAEDDKYKVVGFDLTCTGGRAGHDPKLVYIRDHYKIWGSKKDMDSDVDLAEAILDPYYRGMKAECEKNKVVWHMV